MQARRLGSYELIRRLGEGGMARVYLARDIRLGREVAVKVLDLRLAEQPGFRERFQREARVVASLDHPHIVPLYDFGESDSLLFLVMPYISGGSLQDMLKRAPLHASEVVSYGSQIADALDYAHQRKVIHRDVKPANILLHADGRLMLSDFGLAKILDTSRPNLPKGRPDAGTPEYMAPEQIEGHTDERSDVYGLGVVLYLLLTGHLPFTGSTSNAVMEGHLYRLPDQLRQLNAEVTPAIQEVVLRALAKNADDRYQRAGDLSAALLKALVAGEAEPLPFFLEDETPAVFRSPITPRSPSASSLAPDLLVSPAPLPWEIPTIEEATRRRIDNQSGTASMPFDEMSNNFPGVVPEQFVDRRPVEPFTSMDSGAFRAPIAPMAARVTGGQIPAVGYGRMASPVSSPYSPANTSSASPQFSRRIPGISGNSYRSHSSSHSQHSYVTGPHPAIVPQQTPLSSPAAPSVQQGVVRLWLWLALALVIIVIGLVLLLLHFVQGQHTGLYGAVWHSFFTSLAQVSATKVLNHFQLFVASPFVKGVAGW